MVLLKICEVGEMVKIGDGATVTSVEIGGESPAE